MADRPVLSGGGALTDFGCYGADLITWLMHGQRPTSVFAVTQHLKPDVYPKVDDEATIVVTYPKAQGIIQASWNWPYNRKDMEIYGQTGYVLVPRKDLLRVLKGDQPETETAVAPLTGPEANSLSYLAAVVRGEIQPSGPILARSEHDGDGNSRRRPRVRRDRKADRLANESSPTSVRTTMNTTIIVEASRATLAGTMSFPEVVSRLIPAGVEYYHVDYVGMRKTFYSADGDVVVTLITYEGLPPVAADFDVETLRAVILDSQQRGQKYRDFTRRAMEAGVQGYIAFLRGKRVTYWGRGGDQHTEWFPGAAPAIHTAR